MQSKFAYIKKKCYLCTRFRDIAYWIGYKNPIKQLGRVTVKSGRKAVDLAIRSLRPDSR